MLLTRNMGSITMQGMTNATNPARHYLMTSGKCFGREWMQVAIIRDEQVTWIEFDKALIGWNYATFFVQSGEDWEGMTADQIKAWKLANHYSENQIADLSAEWIEALPALCARHGIPF